MNARSYLLAAAVAAAVLAVAAAGGAQTGSSFAVSATAAGKIGAGGARIRGRFSCTAPGAVHVDAWVFQASTGALAFGHFPPKTSAAPGSAEAKAVYQRSACSGATRRWTAEAALPKKAAFKFDKGKATLCTTSFAHSKAGFSALEGTCATITLR